MRQSKEEAARTRQRIVETAARLYRQHGLTGIGLAELMGQAGLTHGGFYKHFPSKEALVAEALAFAMEETRQSLQAGLARAAPGEGLKVLVEQYLSEAHRDRPERGCALAALAGEGGRGDGNVRSALAAGYRRLASLAEQVLPEEGAEPRAGRALVLSAALVGGLLLARAIPDRAESDRVLRETRQSVLATFGSDGMPDRSPSGQPGTTA